MSKKENKAQENTEAVQNEQAVDETVVKEATETTEAASEKTAPETSAGKQEGEEPDPLEALNSELEKEKNLLLRTAAEYENFRKRTEREKRAIYSDATAEAVKAILPIADSLEYAVKAQDGATEDYQKGLEMIQSQFDAALEKLGVTPIGKAGEEFNPELHNAVAHIEDETVADNTIVQVFQKGYALKEKVIRHAMVKVAN